MQTETRNGLISKYANYASNVSEKYKISLPLHNSGFMFDFVKNVFHASTNSSAGSTILSIITDIGLMNNGATTTMTTTTKGITTTITTRDTKKTATLITERKTVATQASVPGIMINYVMEYMHRH